MCVREKVCGEQTDFAFCPPVLQNDEEALLSAATLTDKKTNFRASRCFQAPRPRSLRESLMFFLLCPWSRLLALLLPSSISAAACFNFAPRSTKNYSKKGVSSQRITSCLQPKLSDFSLFHSRLSRLLAAFNSPSVRLHLCVSSSATWPQRCKTPLTLP